MYLKTLTCALAVMIAPAMADESWLTNVDKAAEQAAKENKVVLVEFTGSDWCPPCKALKSEVFDSAEFKTLADKSLVLVELDFPREKEIPQEQKTYNETLSQKYSVRGYPTVLLMDDKQNVFWKRVGGGSKDDYLASLKKGIESKDVIIQGIEKAKSAEGMDKANALDALLKAMPADLAEDYASYRDEIIALDKDDTLGYAKKKAEKDLAEKQQKELRETLNPQIAPLAQEKKFDEIQAKLDEYSKKADLVIPVKQEILMISAQTYMMKGDLDKTSSVLDEAVKLDPNTEMAGYANQMKNYIKNNREEIEKQIKENNKL